MAGRSWTGNILTGGGRQLGARSGYAPDMGGITRHDVTEAWAHAGLVEAGDFVFVSYCAGSPEDTTAEQVHAALDDLERKLALVHLSLAAVVKVEALFADIWEIPIMESVFRERFDSGYPARKSIETRFAHAGLRFQLDAVAYRDATRTTVPHQADS